MTTAKTLSKQLNLNELEVKSMETIHQMQAQPTGAAMPKTTAVMAILTAKAGVTRQQIMNIMPDEIRATVKLYLDGKIRQWYSRGDGRGVILFLDATTADEAHAIMEALPLTKEDLMDHEYIPVGPLMPLRALIGGALAQQ